MGHWACYSSLLSFPQRRSAFSPEQARERTEPLPPHPLAREGDSSQPYMHDSQAEARKLFECLIHPVTPQKFFKWDTNDVNASKKDF